jgi:hypothetical protein
MVHCRTLFAAHRNRAAAAAADSIMRHHPSGRPQIFRNQGRQIFGTIGGGGGGRRDLALLSAVSVGQPTARMDRPMNPAIDWLHGPGENGPPPRRWPREPGENGSPPRWWPHDSGDSVAPSGWRRSEGAACWPIILAVAPSVSLGARCLPELCVVVIAAAVLTCRLRVALDRADGTGGLRALPWGDASDSASTGDDGVRWPLRRSTAARSMHAASTSTRTRAPRGTASAFPRSRPRRSCRRASPRPRAAARFVASRFCLRSLGAGTRVVGAREIGRGTRVVGAREIERALGSSVRARSRGHSCRRCARDGAGTRVVGAHEIERDRRMVLAEARRRAAGVGCVLQRGGDASAAVSPGSPKGRWRLATGVPTRRSA